LKSNINFPTKILLLLPITFLFTIKIASASLNDGGSTIHRTLTQEIGKGLGVFTAGFLVVGFSYVILTRSYILIRKYVDKKLYPEIITASQEIYSKYRKPLFYLHVSINTIAIVFGTLHGLLVLIRNRIQAYLGWLAILIMIASSLSGFIMWLKIRPIWDSKDIRSMIRASHRQWILSFLLVFVLVIHVALSPD